MDTLTPVATRIPYHLFTDAEIYRREQEKIFSGPHWNFVALAAELPQPGDFKTTFLGDTPIVVTRDKAGALHAFVNRCAHRGALVCREMRGNKLAHQCVYHQWTYEPSGDLIGVPFRKGINGKGGYEDTFDTAERSLQKLAVSEYRGLIFASADPGVEPLLEYLGPEMTPWIDRLFGGRELVVLGYTRQEVGANWKLYAENVRDPYHASLLHLFHTTFGIYRSSMGGGIIQDATGRHSFLRSFKIGEAAETKDYKDAGLRTYQQGVKLADAAILEARDEFPIPATNAIQQIFPNLLIAQIQNTLMVRQIVPKGPSTYELIFTYFGYADDDDDLRAKRMLQANFVGPAGYISLEDGYATELVQQAVADGNAGSSYIDLGGRTAASDDNLVSEGMLRSFWTYYRGVMDLDDAF
jgi:anthranilate 1,2-dioxygenase large subunit